MRSERVKDIIRSCRQLLDAGDKKGYDGQKRKLPGFIFMSEIMPNTSPDKQGNPRPEARWRVQEAARLNGLVMLDIDHIDNPVHIFGKMPKEWFEDGAKNQVMLVHITPSGKGLRVVFKADSDIGDLSANQHHLAQQLGVEPDEACKDASRTSFACQEEDILFINDAIFEYQNDEFDKRFGEVYRGGKGHTEITENCRHTEITEITENSQPSALSPQTSSFSPQPTYHGTPMQRICDAWILEYPKVETRHGKMLEAASDLRYLVESPEELTHALLLLDCVRQISEERGMREIEQAAESAWTGPRYKKIPQRVQKVLIRAGVDDVKDVSAKEEDAGEKRMQMSALRTFAQRLRPLMAPPYDTVCEGVEDENLLSHIFAAGTMFCTLMTRCTYTHYDGQEHRMNPQTLIIAPPASGKSGVDTLNKQVMSVLRAQDQISRNALKEYKRKRKERATSSKEQKQAALVEPQGMIRVLLSNTSNNQFYKRLVNAREEVDQELLWLHVYMFDSELASANKANGGADWIGKRDMELKAFENEDAGSDYANDDSVNDFVPVHWNMVTTGTAVALAKKFTMANINDGLATRVAITPMDPRRYKMIARGTLERNLDREVRLKQWGFWMDRLKGHLNIDRLVDHVYELCSQSAQEAEATDDEVLDTLRRRAVFYAEWFTVPRIVARLRREDGSTAPMEELTVTDDDLRWATVMYDAVVYWQDYFFGQMLQDSWENAKRSFQPRQRTSRNAQLYAALPEEFDKDIVAMAMGISQHAAENQLSRWAQSGYIVRIKKGKYKKILTQII